MLYEATYYYAQAIELVMAPTMKIIIGSRYQNGYAALLNEQGSVLVMVAKPAFEDDELVIEHIMSIAGLKVGKFTVIHKLNGCRSFKDSLEVTATKQVWMTSHSESHYLRSCIK
jgi:hypothetical protein